MPNCPELLRPLLLLRWTLPLALRLDERDIMPRPREDPLLPSAFTIESACTP